MKMKARTATMGVALSAGLGLVGGQVAADGLRFDNLFVVGDSLSDGGTYSQVAVAAFELQISH
jgi:phospholipase/lecithinase/hemolysin